MPKFLNVLNMNENEIQNFVVHNTSSGIAKAGALILDGTLLKYHNGTGYITLGDSDVATSSAAGVVKLFNDTDVTESGVTAVSTTANRWYGVQLTENDKMVVNVPWEDTTIANTDTFRTVAVDTNGDGSVNNTLTTTEDLVLKKGSNITLAEAGGVITISSTDTNTQLNNAGVTGMALTGMVTSSTADVATTDSILVAIGKLEARTALNDDKVTNSQVSTDVTLGTGSHDYLSISGQAITLGAIDLTADVTGDLPISEGGTGQSTAAAAANALLNTDQGGALSIGASTDTITIAGNLTVTGTQTTTLSNTVKTGDNMLELATGNAANATDFGWYGKFVDSGTKYAGMHWDASATKFKLGYGDDVPGTTIDWDTAGELEVGKLTTTDLVIGGHTISDVDVDSEDSNADDHLMTAKAIVNLIADNENSFITSQRAISSTPTDGATGTAISSDWAFDNVKTTVPTGAVFTDTVDMGSGFTVAATTTGTGTTITEGDSLTLAAGTGITTTGTSDGVVTITNSAPNVTQTTITGNAGTATVLEAGAVGGVKVVELTHGVDGVVNENTSNSTNSAEWTITHGMGNGRFYKVEVVQDSGDYDTVYVDVQRPLDTTIKITFGAVVANGAYRAMIQRMA